MAAPKIAVLGQAKPGSNATTALYTVPASRRAVCSTLVVCEVGGAATTFRVHVGINGAAAAVGNAEFYNVALAANSHIGITEGTTLAAADVLYVESASGNVTFTLHGEETDVPAS